MIILKIDRREGIIRLSLQVLEDLWHLHKVLEPGDFVRAKTYRKVSVKRGSDIHEGEKKPVNLTIRLEKSEFHQYTGKLRLSGEIVSGPEDIQLSSRHTITVDPGMVVSVKKQQIKPYQIERLQKAKVKEAVIFFAAIDRDQADFGLLTEMGLQMKGTIHYRKTETDDRTRFYQEILKTLESQECGRIVVCGPGFERENLLSFMKNHQSPLLEKTILEHAHTTGKPGIQEVIKSSASRILRETRLSRETAHVEKLLAEIRKKGLAVYGEAQVKKAAEYGALESLLVSEIKVKEFEPLIDKAESVSSKIIIISAEHESGEQLLSLGGIAGFLRYRLQ